VAKLRGVKTETVRVPLSEGDWIDIKRVLTVGEERDIIARSVREVRPDGSYKLDDQTFSFTAAAIYILGWSLLGLDGQPIPWPATKPLDKRVDVLRALDADTLKEIEDALASHRERQEAEKNAPGGEIGSAPISPSAS
jgi:hypothetical protein